jgi:hypothetical protein
MDTSETRLLQLAQRSACPRAGTLQQALGALRADVEHRDLAGREVRGAMQVERTGSIVSRAAAGGADRTAAR